MAHIEQFNFIKTVKSQYSKYFTGTKVLEVGSLDINGSIRQFFSSCDYIGIDVAEGKGVDIVCEGQNFSGVENSYDVVISCECFEHNPYWDLTLKNMYKLCKPEGIVIITCATTGRKEHGTMRSEPESSPLTVNKNWNYYKNLEENDFRNVINFDESFTTFNFLKDLNVFDLYFYGIKK